MAEEEKKKKIPFWVKILIYGGVVLILCLMLFPYVDKAWGYTVEKTKPFVGPITSGIKDSFGFVSKGLSEASKVLKGEEDFSLEGKVEERKKTGIEISELKPLFGEDGLYAYITVWGFGKEIEPITVSISCNFSSVFSSVNGEVSGVGVKNGELEISNPSEKQEIIVKCVPKGEFDITSDVGEVTVKFELRYPISSNVELETFVSPLPDPEIEKRYVGTDLAFKELEKGSYDEYGSKIPSEMDYIRDVEVIMNFYYQPLFVGKENELVFKFEKKNTEGKVDFKGFNIKLPIGITFKDDCNILELSSDNVWKIKGGGYGEISKELNSDNKETGLLGCKVDITNDALGGSIGQIVKKANVVGTLKYGYTLKKEKVIEINKGGINAV